MLTTGNRFSRLKAAALSRRVLGTLAALPTVKPTASELGTALDVEPGELAVALINLERFAHVETWRESDRDDLGELRVMLSQEAIRRLGLTLSPRGDRWLTLDGMVPATPSAEDPESKPTPKKRPPRNRKGRAPRMPGRDDFSTERWAIVSVAVAGHPSPPRLIAFLAGILRRPPRNVLRIAKRRGRPPIATMPAQREKHLMVLVSRTLLLIPAVALARTLDCSLRSVHNWSRLARGYPQAATGLVLKAWFDALPHGRSAAFFAGR